MSRRLLRFLLLLSVLKALLYVATYVDVSLTSITSATGLSKGCVERKQAKSGLSVSAAQSPNNGLARCAMFAYLQTETSIV